ncbi:hypothetical protein BN871_FJ_00120 [Paenibacillus sp. P22]|nr:hypothetical protein BN871_FJ_00120 [Paenibacillus sp. P22]
MADAAEAGQEACPAGLSDAGMASAPEPLIEGRHSAAVCGRADLRIPPSCANA